MKRTFAKYAEVKEGDVLRIGEGFTCIRPGVLRIVHRDLGGLYLKCHQGKHYIDAQLDRNHVDYIGLYPAARSRR